MLFIIFSSFSKIFAIELEKADILSESYFIQIGVFKKNYSVNKARKDLSNEDIYIEQYNGLHRIYVVNILNKNDLKKKLQIVKKYYPDAFVAKRPKLTFTKMSTEPIMEESVEDLRQLVELPIEKIKKINNNPLNEPKLDSISILKTRKSFL